MVVQKFELETWIFVPCTVYRVHTQRDGTLIRSECFVQRNCIGQDLYLTMCTSTQRLLWIEVSVSHCFFLSIPKLTELVQIVKISQSWSIYWANLSKLSKSVHNIKDCQKLLPKSSHYCLSESVDVWPHELMKVKVKVAFFVFWIEVVSSLWSVETVQLCRCCNVNTSG